MFTLMTRKDAASRLFCYQWLEPLRRGGVLAKVYPPSSVRLYEIFCERRGREPLVLLAKAIYWYLLVPPTRLWQIARAFGSDAVFIQRGMWRYDSPPFFEKLAAVFLRWLGGAKIIYEFDDALYVYVPAHRYHTRFELADLVITGNEELASYAEHWNRSVALVEASLDLDYYELDTVPHATPTVIGWVGTHPDELQPLRLVFEELARRARFVLQVIGPPGGELAWNGIDVVYVPWTLEDEIANLRRFDIGIMPLRDTEYNRGREGFKLKQYMAMGLPVVASAVGKNTSIVEDGVNGFLVSTHAEWLDRLQQLLQDPSMRGQMGRQGRRLCEERYDLRQAVPTFIQRLEILTGADSMPATGARPGSPGRPAAEDTDSPPRRLP